VLNLLFAARFGQSRQAGTTMHGAAATEVE
jgi:hypothetical protein